MAGEQYIAIFAESTDPSRAVENARMNFTPRYTLEDAIAVANSHQRRCIVCLIVYDNKEGK